jgi:hypothetical protein
MSPLFSQTMIEISDALFSESTAEVLGLYSFGGAAIVRATNWLPADVTLAHEAGHRQLCASTSLGLYMMALAQASHLASNDGERTRARSSLREVVEYCWFVHEGYATACQLAYCLQTGRIDLMASIEQALPEAYKSALCPFLMDADGLRRLMILAAHRFGKHNNQDWYLLAGGAMEIGAHIIARAAMSIPLSDVISQAEVLPSTAVSARVRELAPDIRLEKLRHLIRPEFLLHCFCSLFEVVRSDLDPKTLRSQDEMRDSLARQTCQHLGLPYESPVPAHFTDAFKRLGCEQTRLEFVDGRDAPSHTVMSAHADADIAGPRDLSGSNFTSLDSATYLFAQMRKDSWGDIDPSIVCEVGLLDEAGHVDVCIHAYCSKAEFLQLSLRWNATEQAIQLFSAVHPNAALPLILFASEVDFPDLWTLPRRFPNRSWSWVFLDSSLQASYAPYLTQFGEVGRIYAVPMFEIGSNILPAAAVFVVPPTPTQFGEAWKGAGLLEGVPSDIGLIIYESRLPQHSVSVVKVTALNRLVHHDKIDAASFEHACVAEALLQGYYSTLLRAKLGGVV